MTYVKRWRNKVLVAPADVAPGDGFALKVVCVIYDHHWTVYQGPADWPDDKVADQGDAIYDPDLAGRLFWVLSQAGLRYDVL